MKDVPIETIEVKEMKKTLLTLTAMLLLLVSMSGCTKTAPKEEVWTDQLKSAGKIVIGTSPDYPPYEGLNVNGEIEGFDIDMVNTLISYLEENCEIEFAPMEFSTIVTAVQTGQVDIGLSGFTYDPERDVIFSTPYLKSAQMIVVKKDSTITSAADLNGKTVGAQLGTTGADAANEIEGVKEVVLYNDNLVGFESLNNNIIDAMVTDYGVAKNFESTGNYTVLEEALVDESMSIIIKNENKLLADKINELIDQFLESDSYQELVDKWGV